MGNTVSTQSAATVRSIVSSGSDLEAARKLFQSSSSSLILSPLTNNRLRDALVSSSSCSGSSMMSPLLLQARHSYANFLLRDESIKLALPSSLFESEVSSTASRYLLHQAQQQGQHHQNHHHTTGLFASAGKFIKNFIFTILQKIQDKANQFSSLLVGVANFAMKNPRLILAGSVGIASLAGVAYFLVVNQDILRQYRRGDDENHDDDDDDESMMFSELEKQLIRQKIQAQSDLDHEQKKNFCPIENEKRNSHLSLYCPITCELFDDPVFVTTSGHTFERRAITQWILNFSSSSSSSASSSSTANGDHNEQQQQALCPITRVPISLENLVPNLALKEAVREYLMEQQEKNKKQQQEETNGTQPRKASNGNENDDDLD